MAVRLSEVERKYFIRKLGETISPSMPINDIKKRYWVKTVPNLPPTPSYNDMEWMWMMKFISDAGGTIDEYWADEWKEMVKAIGKVPSKYRNENKLIFYLNAP
jgi:hypothetical protein